MSRLVAWGLALSAVALAGYGQATNAPEPKSNRPFRPQVIRELWDVSGSLDEGSLATVRDHLRSIEQAHQVSPTVQLWEVRSWATLVDVLALKGETIRLPAWPTVNCKELTGEGGVLRSVREQHQKKCEDDLRRHEQTYRRAISGKAGEIEAARPSRQREARQTCLYKLLQHISRDRRPVLNVVITDGKDEACGAVNGDLSTNGTSRVVLILVPAESDAAGSTDPLEREQELRSRLPGVPVIWASGLDTEWHWLGDLLDEM